MTQKEAMNILKEFHDKSALFSVRTALDTIIPELKESEDEKIKKEIIKHFISFNNGYYKKPSEDIIDKWIAWLEKQGGNKHKFIIGDIISNNNIIYRVDNIVKNCIGQDCYFLVDIESENNGTRYLKLTDSKGKTHNSGETTWLCEQVDAKFEKQGEQNTKHKTMFVKFICKKDWHGIGDYCYGKIYNGYPCEKEQKGYDVYDDNHIPTFCDEDFIDEYFIIVTEEKQGEQKPTEAKPKFKVGDWIIKNDGSSINVDYSCCEITKAENGNYTIESTYGYKGYNTFETFEKDYHLWTIQDAKDGDVLTCYSDIKGQPIEQTGIIKQYIGRHGGCSNSFKAHFGVDWDNNVVIEGYMGSSNICPSTKEQRDMLFQKMKEAGYEWDEKKKELKKFEKKQDWNEEDEMMLECVLDKIGDLGTGEMCKDWLKSLKERMKGE